MGTTEKLETARAEGIAAKKAAGELPADGEISSEAISEAGIAGAPPPIDETSDSE